MSEQLSLFEPTDRIRGKPLIPAACWSPDIPIFDGYSLMPPCAGEMVKHIFDCWRDPDMEQSCDFMDVWRHIHTCPVCVERAEGMPRIVASVPTNWLQKAEL